MPWRRGDVGFELGAVVVATIATFGAIIACVTIGFVVTAPDFATLPIAAVAIAISVVVPIVVYPVSYTLWQAIDLIMRPAQTVGPDSAAGGARIPEDSV